MIADSIQKCKRDKSPRAPIATHEGFHLFIGPGSMPAATMAETATPCITAYFKRKCTNNVLINGIYNLFYFFDFIFQPLIGSLCIDFFCYVVYCVAYDIFYSIFINASIFSHSHELFSWIMRPMLRI